MRVAAGEPIVFAYQPASSAGIPESLAGRAFVFAIYDSKPTSYGYFDATVVTGSDPLALWRLDGTISEGLRGSTGLRWEISERLDNGRDIIASGAFTIDASAPMIGDFDSAPIARYIVRILRKNDPETIDAPLFSTKILAFTNIAATVLPAFATQPSITGSTAVGSTLTGNDGTANASISARQWLLNSTAISGATGMTYTANTAGQYSYRVTATNSAGSTAATSNAFTVAAAIPAPAFTTQPSISPTSGNVGATFAATDGTVSNGSITGRKWFLNGTQIGSDTTVKPVIAGSLTLENTALGSDGSTIKTTSSAVTVAAVAVGTPTIAFASSTATVTEGNTGTTTISNVINVTRNNVTGALTINLTYSGTTTAGVDYATAPVSATVAAGQSSATFDIVVNGDTTVESDETIIINAVLANYTSSTATRTITITNDDAATVTQLTFPSSTDFPATVPFTVSRSSAGGDDTHTFDPMTTRPTATNTYYVGAGGDNAADGLTWATRRRSLGRALALVNATGNAVVSRIIAQAGQYLATNVDANGYGDSFGGVAFQRGVIIEPCDSTGTVLPISDGRTSSANQIISINNAVLPTFVATSDATVWVSTYTGTQPVDRGAWDTKFTNEFNRPLGLRPMVAAMIADVTNPVAELQTMNTKFGVGSFFLDTVNKKMWVRTKDGRAPDAQVFFSKFGRHLWPLARYGADNNFWARNLDLWGRGIETYGNFSTAAGQTQTVTVFDTYIGSNCDNNAVSIQHSGKAYMLRNVVCESFLDGFAYSMDNGNGVSSASGGTMDDAAGSGLSFFELDCQAVRVGNKGPQDGSTNGSTSHRGCLGVRVNSSFKDVENRQICDIESAKTVNFNLKFNGSTRASNAAGGLSSSIVLSSDTLKSAAFIAASYPSDGASTAKVWVDKATFAGTAIYGLESYRGAQLRVRNVTETGYQRDSDGSVIGTWA